MLNFQKLEVYQDSKILIKKIYVLSCKWPLTEKFGLSDQAKRAAVSVALNIAEGTSRTKKELAHFLDLARGSAFECFAALDIAHDLKYISNEQFASVSELIETLARRIHSLKRSLEK